MSDQPIQTWDEMKKLYPNQWLMVVEFETNKFGDITSGVVVEPENYWTDCASQTLVILPAILSATI